MTTGIDFSYKKNAFRVTYDIESLPSVFTISFMTPKSYTLMFFGDETYDHITNDQLLEVMKNFARRPHNLSALGWESIDSGEINLKRYYVNNKSSIEALKRDLQRVLLCYPLDTDAHLCSQNFAEYWGWNSARYDLTLIILAFIMASKPFTGNAVDGYQIADVAPARIREMSDAIITFDDKEWKFPRYLEETIGISQKTYKLFRNEAIWADGHIDSAKFLRAEDTEGEAALPPALKKEMAKDGLDVIMDELVSISQTRSLTDQEIFDLIDYNMNDVMGTWLISQKPVIQAALETRDIVREMYPYTSARAMSRSLISKYTPAERDATTAQISGLVLIGPNRIKPEDNPVINYKFPLPKDGEEYPVEQDLLEYIQKKEEFIHPLLVEFFDHFRGRSCADSWDDYLLKKEQPITHSATLNVPYYRDGKPVDSYIRVSTGGAHGSVCAGLSRKTPAQVEAWIRSDEGAEGNAKPTIDLQNVLHIDWSSFYPVMASKLQLYKTKEGVDRYTDIIKYRIHIKETLPLDRSTWTDDDVALQEKQKGLKLILNSATGAGNMHQKYALLPLDNKTQSMRLIGNMLIWTLAQRLTQAGAYVISTNTDGLYIAGMTVPEAQAVIDLYVKDYGMDVEPEVLSRFINRDTSNRMEFVDHHFTLVNGIMKHGKEMEYGLQSLGQNVQYPLVAAHAALRYMVDDEAWLSKPYDRARLEQIINDLALTSSIDGWYHVFVGTKARRLTVNGQPMQKINRILLTREGDELGQEISRTLTRGDYRVLWNNVMQGKSWDEIAKENDFKWTIDLPEETEVFVVKKIAKQNRRDSDKYEWIRMPEREYSEDEWDKLWKLNNAHSLAVITDDETYVPIKTWKTSVLSGYPTSTGRIVNLADDLDSFDMTDLDLTAYTDWAERLLAGWKITGDIPEIHLSQLDDTVGPYNHPKKLNSTDQALALIDEFYSNIRSLFVD